MQSLIFWLTSRCFSSYARCTFDFYELRKLALCSQVNSCISFVPICWAKHVFSCRLNSIYCALCLHLIYFSVRYSRPRATMQRHTMLLFLLRGRNSLCVQFMSFSNFAFCAKLTKIYSCDTTAKMQSFFASFIPLLPRAALCHFIL